MSTIKLEEIKRKINKAVDIKGAEEGFENSSQQMYQAVKQ